MNCAICKRPLLEGATACVVCGAPVQAPIRTSLPGGPPPVALGAGGGGAPSGPPPVGVAPMGRMSIPSAAPGSAPYAAPPAPYAPYAYPQAQGYAPAPQPYPPAYPAAYPAQNQAPYAVVPYGAAPNNMAIASFVCSLLGLIPLWIGFILCVLAITFGVIGMQRAAQLPGQRGRGLAIAGLVIGIVCLPLAACGL